MVSIIKRVLVGIGLILTGLLISSIELHPHLHTLRTYQAEIFYTNCLILLSPQPIATDRPLPSVPAECATIEWLLPAGLMASGIVLLIFGFKGTACFFSALNLAAYLCLYCNTLIDSSFGVYAHALEILTSLLAFLYIYLTERQQAQLQKNHPYHYR